MHSSAAVVLDVEAAIAEPFSLAMRQRLRDAHGIFLWTWLPKRSAFASLKTTARAVLAAVSAHWMENEDCYPSELHLARAAGCTERTVRLALHELERAGWLVIVRSRRTYWKSDANRYSAGPVFLAELAGLPASHAPRAKALTKSTATSRPSSSPAKFAGDSPAKFAAQVSLTNFKTSSSSPQPFETTYEPEPAPANEQEERSIEGSAEVTAEDRELGREAVVARLTRAYPSLRPSVERHELELAAAAVAGVLGSLETKRQAIADAIEGAWLRSTGVPRGSYIWRSREDFAAHADAGRILRTSRERARDRATEPSPAAVDGVSFPTRAELAAGFGDLLSALGSS
jgi:hypothetical protein